MTTTINADNGVSSGSAGLKQTADNSGVLALQTNGTTALSIDASQNVTISGASSNINSANTFGFKNRIINGGMTIDQRNAGAAVTPTASGTYTIDRWGFFGSQASKLTFQQNAGSITPPSNFVNYLGITSTSAYTVGAAEAFRVYQPIEGYNVADLGWGTASAKTVSLSFWVRSSLTGTFGGAIYNNAGNRVYVFSFTISAANTWEQKTITIPGDTTGTWLTNNGVGLVLQFSLGAGSTLQGTPGSWGSTLYLAPTGQTSVVGTNGATFYITGVQLEVGSQATSFDFRSYGTELGLCQRYYQKYGSMIIGSWGNSNYAYQSFIYAVPMRTAPTWNYSGIGYSSSSTLGTNSSTAAQVRISFIVTAAGGYGYSTFDMDTSGAEL